MNSIFHNEFPIPLNILMIFLLKHSSGSYLLTQVTTHYLMEWQLPLSPPPPWLVDGLLVHKHC